MCHTFNLIQVNVIYGFSHTPLSVDPYSEHFSLIFTAKTKYYFTIRAYRDISKLLLIIPRVLSERLTSKEPPILI